MTAKTFGFIGLGNMGGPMCTNLMKAGFDVIAFDAAGTEGRALGGAKVAACLEEVAQTADVIFLSLPDGKIVRAVCSDILAIAGLRASVIVDFSTTGPEAAREVGEMLGARGLAFVDAPVSGGKAGAIAGTVTVIVAGPDEATRSLKGAFEAVGGNVFHVGPNPGQGQAVKLLNNFLSATAMAATSEAVLFGQTHGVDMTTILDVVNVSTGRNTASADKFPDRIVTGTYDAEFAMALMTKDVGLYLKEVQAAGSPDRIGAPMSALWNEARDALPDSDFTEIYRFIAGEK